MTPARTKFLAECWSSYPPFPSEPGWIGGRLRVGDDGEFAVRHVTFRQTKFDSLIKDCTFSPELLRDGDRVAIREDGSLLRLLVPVRQPLEHLAFSAHRAEQWAAFTDRVRAFFKERNFIEALTPTLVPSPGTEPYLDAFTTEWINGSDRRLLYLPTSPEFHLKKLLARDFERVFEIKTCFRNGEIGPHHQPEFQMLEWYRAYATLDAIADDVKALLAPLKVREVSMADLFKTHLGFDLTPQTTREELRALCDQNQIVTAADDAWDDVFFRLFLEKIEHAIDPEIPHLIRYYPPSQAALSRILPSGWADRFEIYYKGLEIANAFHELNDPNENIARFDQDNADKIRTGRAPVPIDAGLMKALETGMPPSGGIALGLDRLFMALQGETEIANARAFAFTQRRD
jgi:lysyl-tRNA synthetase class 2